MQKQNKQIKLNRTSMQVSTVCRNYSFTILSICSLDLSLQQTMTWLCLKMGAC